MAGKTNIFDLSKLAVKPSNTNPTNPTNSMNPTNVSPELEYAKLIDGCTEVPREEWCKLQFGTFVKYLRTDGEFRRGGYVVSIINTKDRDNTDTIKIELSHTPVRSFTKNVRTWSVYAGSINKLWRQEESVVMQMPQFQQAPQVDLTEIKNDISILKKNMDFIKQELQGVKNDLTRVIHTVKKLHNL